MSYDPSECLRLGRWEDALADVGEVDAVICDCPYSARTHSGHSDGITGTGRTMDTKTRVSKSGKIYRAADHVAQCRVLNYDGWTHDDVTAFVASWAPRCKGWFVTITSHDLAPVWSAALTNAGRHVFAPLPWVAKGSRVRLAGDGPSSWTCWIVVARPRAGEDRHGRPYSKWGTLPGAYVITSDRGSSHIGGKPLRLMEALVRDYTRPGDLVADPCAGYGTTLAAALRLGRSAVGAEMDPKTHAKGVEYLHRYGRARDMFAVAAPAGAQESLI